MRRLGVLGFGVVVVLLGGLFVFGLDSASPPPASVLAAGRGYVAAPRSVGFRGSETITTPAGAASLVRHREVNGSAAAAGSDMLVTEGGPTYEYRLVSSASGVFVRVGSASTPVAQAGWVHAASYLGFESAVRSSDAASVTAVADSLADGALIPVFITAAVRPARHGSAVRHLDVTFDAARVGAGGALGAVSALTGQMTVDGDNRPVSVLVRARMGDTTIDVDYALSWRPPAAFAPPPPASVIAEV